MKNSKGFSSGTDLRRRIFTILITVLAVACMIPRFGVRAANPSSGTLNASDTTPKTWVGTATGPSSPQGESTCAEGVNCDTYILTLSTAATWVGKKARVRISWIAGADDFDLYIHKCPAGSSTPSDCNATAVVASSTQGAPTTSEQADIDPNSSGTGDYSVHVVYFTATLGDEYNGSASVFIPPNASKPPSTEPGPIYTNYQSPAGMGDSSGEPSIGVDWGTGIVMFQAVLQTLRVSFDDSVPPATASWALKNGPNTSTTSLDPILFTDSKTGRTLVAQLASTQSLSAFTDNDGFNYTPNQGGGPASGVDHQTYGGGPFKPGIAGRLPTTSYPNAVYYASQDIGTATCSLSRDGGLTFQQETPMWTATQCGGLHGHIKVAPNGTVYVPNKSCSSTQAVAVSVNNGLTWTIRQVPNSSPPPAGGSDPSVGIGAGGKLYFGYVNSDGTPHVAVSDDQGITWHDDQNVGDDPHLGTGSGIKNTAFPEVVAGDNNRAAFFFLGTPSAGAGTADDNGGAGPNFSGVWHGYIATTYDGGVSWVTVDATPSDPVQLGVICTNGTLCPAGTRNLLDFNDVTVDRRGRIIAAYADGCISSGCIAKGNGTDQAQQTRSSNDGTAKATIIRFASGKGLFSAFDTSTASPILGTPKARVSKTRAKTRRG